MSELLINRIRPIIRYFNISFGHLLKFFLLYILILTFASTIFNIPLEIKIQVYITSILIFIILTFFCIIFKRNDFVDLFIRRYKSLNEFLFIIDLLILFSSILLALKISKNVLLSEIDYFIVLNIFCMWFLSSLSFDNFFPNFNVYYWKYIWRYLKTHFVITLSIVSLCILFEVTWSTFYTMFLISIIYNFSSLMLYSLRYFYLIPDKDSDDRFFYLLPKKSQIITNPDNVLFQDGKYGISSVKPKVNIKEKLLNSFKEYANLFEKIEKVIELESFELEKSVILRTADIFNIKNNDDNSLNFLVNLHPLNDQRRINKYLIEVNKKLKTDGIFIGCFQTIRSRYKKFLTVYPFLIAQVFYFIDFIWARVFPKLLVLKGIYFSLSKGRNRAISLSGGMGRIIYCGFDFIDIFDYGLLTFFIAYKKGEPKTDIKPSYGPIFSMRRVGKNGKEIKVLKLRTMHPYSEFLQEFVHQNNKLEDGGKFKDDFRITSWGKIFRKFWLDELPMLINFIKGDLKLVGVRPLSFHYFELYPEELKNLRIKTKPGLFPPYYYDMPKSFDEIVKSELNYLEKYFKNPIKTDFHYFLKIAYNIIFKKARSK